MNVINSFPSIVYTAVRVPMSEHKLRLIRPLYGLRWEISRLPDKAGITGQEVSFERSTSKVWPTSLSS